MADSDTFGFLDWLRLLSTIAWPVVFVIWPQMVFAITLLIIGGAFITFNAMIFWFTVVRKENASSVAPIFGGIFAAIGIAILPVSESWKWLWVPLAIDWGGLPFFLSGWYSKRMKS